MAIKTHFLNIQLADAYDSSDLPVHILLGMELMPQFVALEQPRK